MAKKLPRADVPAGAQGAHEGVFQKDRSSEMGEARRVQLGGGAVGSCGAQSHTWSKNTPKTATPQTEQQGRTPYSRRTAELVEESHW